MLKNDLSHDEFIKLCNVIAEHCPYKKKLGDSLNGSRPTSSI